MLHELQMYHNYEFTIFEGYTPFIVIAYFERNSLYFYSYIAPPLPSPHW